MSENQLDSQNNQPSQTPDLNKPEEGKGTMVGSIIIIIIIILGAVYLFFNKAEAPETTDEAAIGDESAQVAGETEESDELNTIESDVNIVDQSADSQIGDIESELE